jgi:hypothetical protein
MGQDRELMPDSVTVDHEDEAVRGELQPNGNGVASYSGYKGGHDDLAGYLSVTILS